MLEKEERHEERVRESTIIDTQRAGLKNAPKSREKVRQRKTLQIRPKHRKCIYEASQVNIYNLFTLSVGWFHSLPL